nr:hypothetical protein [Tanacetum cinerariifolium]
EIGSRKHFHYGRTWIDHDENGLLHNVREESQSSSTGFLPSRRRYEFHSGGLLGSWLERLGIGLDVGLVSQAIIIISRSPRVALRLVDLDDDWMAYEVVIPMPIIGGG